MGAPLTVEEVFRLRDTLKVLAEAKRKNQIDRYRPYPKQVTFHSALVRERLFMAGNQLGKTMAGAQEMAYHLTGLYPEWWKGHRFHKPIVAWVGGVTYDVLRDSVQKLLLGGWGNERGTGAIPGGRIESVLPARGIGEMADTIYVSHSTGGVVDGSSTLKTKAYVQGREKWQAGTVHLVWFDEEPPADIYTEGLTRLNATGGIAYMTFTPLLGMSTIVSRFLKEDSEDRHVTQMTIDDVEHISAEQRDRIIASYPEYEREARTKGIPSLGSGRVYPVAQSAIEVDAFPLPDHWPRIAGIDFGYDHPAAGAWLAWDRDSDCVYVYDCYRKSKDTAALNALTVKGKGEWIPVAWPSDGHQHDKGSGEALAQQYRQAGANLLPSHATHDDRMAAKSSTSVEAGVMDILDRMQSGRFKVFKHLNDWWDEFHLYHRADGKIVKERDDILDATRYALMSLRHARTKPRAVERMTERRGSWMVR